MAQRRIGACQLWYQVMQVLCRLSLARAASDFTLRLPRVALEVVSQ